MELPRKGPGTRRLEMSRRFCAQNLVRRLLAKGYRVAFYFKDQLHVSVIS